MKRTTTINPFEQTAVAYEQWFQEFDKIRETEIRAIRRFYDPGLKTVEIGAGTGVFTQALGTELGVEPADAMADIAKAKGLHIIKGTAESIPLPDDSYEQATMITVDCFLNDVPASFREINRILTKDGIFIIAFLNLATEIGQIYEDTKEMDENYRYAAFNTADEIRSMLTDAGFNIVDSCQTIFELANVDQEIREGDGDGVFTIYKTIKA